MARRTARISVIVEYDDALCDPNSHTMLKLRDLNAHKEGLHVFGKPDVTVHGRPYLDVSGRQREQIFNAIQERGGGFVVQLSGLLARADSGNHRRLQEEFWNQISAYLPPEETT